MKRVIPVYVLNNGIYTKTGYNSKSKKNYGVMRECNGKIIRRGRDIPKIYGIRIIIFLVITFLNSKPVFVLQNGIGVIRQHVKLEVSMR
jgi:hypothetical protein